MMPKLVPEDRDITDNTSWHYASATGDYQLEADMGNEIKMRLNAADVRTSPVTGTIANVLAMFD